MAEYDFYYWPIPFRGHPIRYVMAHAGVTWSEVDMEQMAAFKDRPVADRPYPFLAPPVLFDPATGTWLSQLPAIMMYLGRRHGLVRDQDQELRLICDASDILLEITRYHGEVAMWDRASWAVFRTQRLPLWLHLHERFVIDSTGSAPFLFGQATPGLGDLALAGLWFTMAECLPTLRPLLEAEAPRLMALAGRVAETEAIAALRAEWASCPIVYCAGQIEASLLEMLEGDEA
jgi:glutathione S-transferase